MGNPVYANTDTVYKDTDTVYTDKDTDSNTNTGTYTVTDTVYLKIRSAYYRVCVGKIILNS